VTNTNNFGAGSLDAAIDAANITPGLDTIVFNIPGAGVHTIRPTARMLTPTEPVIIDGYTQPGASANTLATGNNAVLLIEIDGTDMAAFEPVFAFGPDSSGSTVRGLVINRMPFHAFLIGPGFLGLSNGNTISGNFIGTDPTGTTVLDGDTNFRISVAGSSNTIGGTTPAARNIIVGGGTFGSGQIRLEEGGGSNVVQGNYMGTNAAGTAALLPPSPNNAILVLRPDNTIGGSAPGAGNVIVASNIGIFLNSGANSNFIQGNLIGTNATGTAALGGGIGISTENNPTNNTIGGSAPGAGKLISFGGIGIALGDGSTGTIVQGNLIGTDITGTMPIGNGCGILVFASNSGSIGGTGAGEGNIIAFNGTQGVVIGSGAQGWRILGNSIFSNGNLGIALSANFACAVGTPPTVNDAGDSDTGANNLQNFPVITSASLDAGNVIISGTLNSTPSTTFRVEFFANASCNASGNGEGQTVLGFTNVTTDGSGNASFGPLVSAVPSGQTVFTSTATDPGNNTSEFSQCLAAPPPFDVTVNPANPTITPGQTQPFTATGTFSDGSSQVLSAGIPAPSGLVGWWPGDGDANDVVGINPGTLVNGATFAPGLVGQAFRLDGVDDLVEIPFNANLSFTNAITIDAWVAPNSIKVGSRIISQEIDPVSCSTPFITYDLEVRGEFGNMAVFFFTTSDDQLHTLVGTSVIPTGTFTHLAATFDGSVAKIYVNGVLENSLAVPGSLKTSSMPIVIGNGGAACRAAAGGLIEFDGLIDELQLFDRALSDSEIEAIFDAGSAGQCKPLATCATWSSSNPAVATIDQTGLATGSSPGTTTITATSAISTSDPGVSGSTTLTVASPNRAPMLTVPGRQTNAVLDTVRLPLVATDPDLDPLTWRATGVPPGLGIDSATGVIAGTLSASAAGEHTVVVFVSDGLAQLSQLASRIADFWRLASREGA